MTNIEKLTNDAAVAVGELYEALEDAEIAWNSFRDGAEWERNRDKWIPVEKELPPIRSIVLAMEADRHIIVANYIGDSKWYSPFKNRDIVHWQPLPKLPESEI